MVGDFFGEDDILDFMGDFLGDVGVNFLGDPGGLSGSGPVAAVALVVPLDEKSSVQ